MACLCLSDTPVGPLTLTASSQGLREVRFGNATFLDDSGPAGDVRSTNGRDAHFETCIPVLETAADALYAYLDGADDTFHVVPLDLSDCTDFQRAVYRILTEVPRGSLVTYGEIAEQLGRGAPRAVGQAVGANPLPVVIPCHRVVAANERLGGFSGGLHRKVALLGLEGIRTREEGPRASVVQG